MSEVEQEQPQTTESPEPDTGTVETEEGADDADEA
jgi:hypothetical protein